MGKSHSLKKKLSYIRTNYRYQIFMIAKLHFEAQAMTWPKENSGGFLKFLTEPEINLERQKELKEIARRIDHEIFVLGRPALSWNHKSKDNKIKGKEVAKLSDLQIKASIQRLLSEMTIICMIAYFRAFLRKYLTQILIKRPDCMKSEKQLTYETLMGFTSIETMREYMATREASKFENASIEEAKDYFIKKFAVDFAQFEEWDRIMEACNRRHVYVHNRGIVNEKYRKDTGNGEIGDYLAADDQYMNEVFTAIDGFMSFLHKNMVAKLKLT